MKSEIAGVRSASRFGDLSGQQKKLQNERLGE
ncbi:hypothetical protein MNBD_PLANCTO02-1754 [hydrothermal vent metagenome]|uniref:Uncharacterized protein n=1 Tax=hydrothermal vent metagenome TaxID=652676 RepID=A0A3B1DDE9_9ZZZZ